jgi:hypothetical protein
MNGERLMTALQGIDDKYLEEAKNIQKGRKLIAIKITAVICACIAIILAVTPSMKPDDSLTLSYNIVEGSGFVRILYSKDYDNPELYFDRAEAGSYIMTDALKKAFDSCPDNCGLAVVITDANGGDVKEEVLIPFVERAEAVMRGKRINSIGFDYELAPAGIFLPKRLLFLLDELECPDDMALVLSWREQQ